MIVCDSKLNNYNNYVRNPSIVKNQLLKSLIIKILIDDINDPKLLIKELTSHYNKLVKTDTFYLEFNLTELYSISMSIGKLYTNINDEDLTIIAFKVRWLFNNSMFVFTQQSHIAFLKTVMDLLNTFCDNGIKQPSHVYND